MWPWVLLAWLAASALVAALHHRFRERNLELPPELAAFLLRFETILAAQHPDVRFVGMLPDQLACLLEVEGQETPVALGDAFGHEQTFPDSFPDYVDRLLGEIREAGLDRIEHIDLAFAAPQLLPQVRSRAWLAAKGCFGDSGLVYRELNDELVTVYVVDDPQCMIFVCREHLRRWRKSAADIHNLALANLARLDSRQTDLLHGVSGPLRVDSGDGYDAARLLLLEHDEGLLVAVPDRDVLWVGQEEGVDLETLMADTREIAGHSPHPISELVYRVTGGQLQAVRDEARS